MNLSGKHCSNSGSSLSGHTDGREPGTQVYDPSTTDEEKSYGFELFKKDLV